MFKDGYGPSIMDESAIQTANRLEKKQHRAHVTYMHSAARRIVTSLRDGGQTAITNNDKSLVVSRLRQYGVHPGFLEVGFLYAMKVMRERTERRGGCR